MSGPGSLATLARVRRAAGAGTRRPGDRRAGASTASGPTGERASPKGHTPANRCELCGEPLAEPHGHLVDVRERSLKCACRACRLLFTSGGAARGQLRAVPEDVWVVDDLVLPAERWEALEIPVSTAFFFHNSEHDRVAAFFPGPTGATECLLPLDAWAGVVADNPVLASLAPEVEAALVRVGERAEPSPECFLVPIDACYELVGVLRTSWRGIEGGPESRRALDDFFARLRSAARPVSRAGHRD